MKNGSFWPADDNSSPTNRTSTSYSPVIPFGDFNFQVGLAAFEVAFIVALTIVSLVFVISVLYFSYIKRKGYFQDDPAYRYKQHCKRYHAVSAYGHPVKAIPSPTHKFLLTKLPRPSTIYLSVCPWLTSCDGTNGASVQSKILKRNGHNGAGTISVHPLNSPPSLLNVNNNSQSPGEDSVYLTVHSQYSTPVETPPWEKLPHEEFVGVFHSHRPSARRFERSTLPVDVTQLACTSGGSPRKRRSDDSRSDVGGGEKMAPPTSLPLAAHSDAEKKRRASRAAPGQVKEQNRLTDRLPLRRAHKHHYHEGTSRRSGLASGEVLNGNIVAPPIMLMTKSDSRAMAAATVLPHRS